MTLKKRFFLYNVIAVFCTIPFFNALAGKSWDFLNPEDKVDVLFPSAAPANDLIRPIKEMLARLSAQHNIIFNFDLSELDPKKSLYGYYANGHNKRKEAFKKVIDSPSKVIWMGMGGFGATEVIYLLEKEGYQLLDEPKLLIGFSDATKLLLYALKKGWNVLHAPMVAFCQDLSHMSQSNVNKEVSHDPLINVITGKTTELSYQLDVLNNPISIENTSVVGGNFSLVVESLGTDFVPDLCGRILFIEDTVEDGKRFERKFLNLLQNQALDGCLAIFIGNQNLSAGQDLKRLMKDIISTFGITIPIFYSSDFGHGPKNNVLPVGTKARLESLDDGKTALLTISVNESYQ